MTTSMRSLTDQLPDRDELLKAIGLQVAREDSSIFSTIAIFAAGLAIGAGVAYLITSELRNGASREDEEEPSGIGAAS